MTLKTRLFAGAALIGIGTMAQAEIDTDALIAQLQAQGFTRIEVQIGLDQVKVEGIKGTEKYEVIYDDATGAVLKQEIEAVEADDDTSPGVEVRRRLRDFVRDGDDDDSDHDGSDDDDDDDDRDDHDDRHERDDASDDDDHDEDDDNDHRGRGDHDDDDDDSDDDDDDEDEDDDDEDDDDDESDDD